MQRHYLSVKTFIGLMGFPIRKGEIGIPGDSATPEIKAEIDRHVAAGDLVVMGEGYRPKGWLERPRLREEDTDA